MAVLRRALSIVEMPIATVCLWILGFAVAPVALRATFLVQLPWEGR